MESCAVVAHRLVLHLFGSFALQRALQVLVKRGLYAVVFLLRDLGLFVFNFQLEKFFFQPSSNMEEELRAEPARRRVV